MPVETFLEKWRRVARLRRLTYWTGETYLPVIRGFIELHGGRTHPKYVDFARTQITVREGKGEKDRVSFYDHLGDRISQRYLMPSLATLIRQHSPTRARHPQLAAA